MSMLKFPRLQSLVEDMNKNHVDKDRFGFQYKYHFDVIVSIVHNGYDLLIGIHEINYGLVVHVSPNFVAELTGDDYYSLCTNLNLSYQKDNFSSSVFLKLLSSKIPEKYSGYKHNYKNMFPFLKYQQVDESEKKYFVGWNDHAKDHRQARNFSKTEFYLGKAVADYCRDHNISSLWTKYPSEEEHYTDPW